MTTMKTERDGGFTLIEVMVSLALGLLLMAGAFQMHSAYVRQSNRQQALGDMQQSLRVGRDVIARALRGAGAGLTGVPFHHWDCGSATDNYYYPIEFGNNNNEAAVLSGAPRTVFDVVANDQEPQDNPDWLRIASVRTDPESSVPGTSAAVLNYDNATGNLTVADTRPFNQNPLPLIYIDNRAKSDNANSGINALKAKQRHLICARRVTAILPKGGAVVCAGAAPNCGALTLGATCDNPAVGSDDCLKAMVLNPSAIAYAYDQSVTFRVDRTTPGFPARLMASYGPPWQAPVWKVLSENIEDLQIALIYNDGSICGNGPVPLASPFNSIDGPVDSLISGVAPCNFVNLREVRFTLVARSATTLSGFTAAAGVGAKGTGIEDEQPWSASAGTGYIRRTVTTTVQLRNYHL